MEVLQSEKPAAERMAVTADQGQCSDLKGQRINRCQGTFLDLCSQLKVSVRVRVAIRSW